MPMGKRRCSFGSNVLYYFCNIVLTLSLNEIDILYKIVETCNFHFDLTHFNLNRK